MAEQLTSKHLLEAILDQGIRNTNFFNGRLLTADDLRIDQDANRRQHEQLGRTLGTGVVSGLEVSLDDPGSPNSPPLVKVTAGLAFNPRGQAIALPVDIKLALARLVAPAVVGPGLFGACQPPKTTVTPPTDRGVYLLVAAPASGYQERALKHDFSNVVNISGCDSRYAVEGVQFRVAELKLDDLTRLSQGTRQSLTDLIAKDDPASLSKLRNWLAHVCFGTEELADFPKDLLANTNNRSLYLSYGAVDALREANRLDPDKGLTDCEVPLGVLFWTKTGVQFVDMWAVRRRLVPPPCFSKPLSVSERRQVETEAAFLQFQDQVENLFRSTLSDFALTSILAINYFRYLPAVGIIPLAGIRGSRGFDYPRFMSTLAYRNPTFIEGAKLGYLLRDSFTYCAIDLSSGELIWLYLVRENIQAIDNIPLNPPQAYLLFTKGHIPYQADAQYDLSRLDYSNYA
jgi:hypothetical protein